MPNCTPASRFGIFTGQTENSARRVVGMRGDHVAIHDATASKTFKVHYAAILAEPADAPVAGGPASPDIEPIKPTPPPEIASRSDFRVGIRVTFTDRSLQRRIGLIVRVNLHTATLDCDGQKWRVAFELLQHLVDV